MNPAPQSLLEATVIILATLCASIAPAAGEKFGLFTYSVSGDTITITDYPEDGGGEIVIPSEIDGRVVTTIGSGVFYRCSGLTKISIPKGVRYISGDAFDRCRSLTLIEVDPENLEYLSMDGVLIHRSNMSLIRCPEGKAGPYVIPAGVRTIRGNPLETFRLPGGEPDGAFVNCRQLTSLEIPASVARIGSGAFEGCSGLVSIRVAPENNDYASREGVLFDTSETDLIQFPSAKTGHYVIPEGTIRIVGIRWDFIGPMGIPSIVGSGAFDGSTGLTGVTIPSSVTSIGGGAFDGCTGLTGVTIPSSVTNIGDSAFSGCTGLTGVNIPGSVPHIGLGTFEDCISLTDVTISEGVTRIGQRAFAGCVGLTHISIPSGATDICSRAFSECTGLMGVTIPESVTNIEFEAFSGCTALTGVTIPTSVPYIRSGTFEACTSLTDVTISEGVTRIGQWAFAGCVGLTQIAIPSSTTGIGYGAFSGCSGLVEVTIAEGCRDISSFAFDSCKGLTTVTIPSSITGIGEHAFSGCSELSAILVEAGNGAFSSEEGVLFNADRTTLILCPEGKRGAYDIPRSVTKIAGLVWNFDGTTGSGGFDGCRKLTNVSIPSSVTTICPQAFLGCAGLRAVHIPPSVKTIGYEAFMGCTGLTGVTIASGPTYIASGTFKDCTALRHVAIPASVTSIDSDAFSGCTALASIIIPTNVMSIYGRYLNDEHGGGGSGDGAFFGCSGLTTVIFLGDAPSLGKAVFSGAAPGFTIYYLSCSSGFTSPTWKGHPTIRIDERACPAAPWLVGHGLPYDADLHHDLNGDGVSLLMAYALDLDPHVNLGGRLPVPVMDAESMTMSFHAASPGITYRVETSTDLRTWRTEGVTLSGLDVDSKRTAAVPRDAPQRFLRLVVE